MLLGPDGPVIIDLPQAVDAAANNHAFSMLQRDVANMAHYFGRFAPELKSTRYAQEMWALYEAGELRPDSPLTGLFEDDEHAADVAGVMREIDAARLDDARRRAALAEAEHGAARAEEPAPPWLQ
ncbi:RIO1 family protein [compost metagenome]